MSAASRAYMRTVRAAARARGSKRKRLRRKASAQRRRMIRKRRKKRSKPSKRPRRRKRNGMPHGYRRWYGKIRRSKDGRAALAAFRRVNGIPFPPSIREMESGTGKTRYLVGMGRSPVAIISEGPKSRPGRVRKVRGKFWVATDTAGKRIYLLRRSNKGPIGKRLRHVGYAPETHYVPTNDMEDAGTFKKGKYWIHRHDDEGGRYPKVYKDSSGNYVYGKSTFYIDRKGWMRR